MFAVIFGVVTNASCNEINTTITKTSYHTIITCSPQGDEKVGKAYFTLYATQDQPLSLSRQKMKVSYDNKASYVLRGNYDIIKGECNFVLADNKNEGQKEFLAR